MIGGEGCLIGTELGDDLRIRGWVSHTPFSLGRKSFDKPACKKHNDPQIDFHLYSLQTQPKHGGSPVLCWQRCQLFKGWHL